MAVGQGDKEGTKSIDQGKHEEDERWTETVRESIDLGIDCHCMPRGKEATAEIQNLYFRNSDKNLISALHFSIHPSDIVFD